MLNEGEVFKGSQVLPENYSGQRKADVVLVADWDAIEKAQQKGTIVRALVTGADDEFVYAEVYGAISKIPRDQYDAFKDWKGFASFVGNHIYVIIKAIRRADGKEFYEDTVICSRKEAQNMVLKKMWPGLQLGSVVSGVVTAFSDNLVFLDIGSVTAVLPLNELEHKYTVNPQDVVNVGDYIDTKIIDLDEKRKRITVSLKAMRPDPWNVMDLKKGSFALGRIVHFSEYGVHVELATGLQILTTMPRKLELEVGDRVRVMIRDVNKEKKQARGHIHAKL